MKKESAIKLIESIFDITYFIYKELCCKCGCGTFKGNIKFLKKVLKFRILYDEPFTPRSVYRCKKHKDYSTNHDGHGIDVPYNQYDSNQRFRIIEAAIYTSFKRIGIAKDYIHLDDNPIYNKTKNEKVLWLYDK